METFVISIKEKYIINRQEQWPRCCSKKVFNLDLVEFEGEVAGYFAKCKRGQDDETIKRTSLTYNDLFKTENGKSKVKRILVEGDAGIGKTTLCTSVSADWAKGKLFQQFKLLLFLPLRLKKVSSARSLPELLNQLHHSSEICTSVSSYLMENEGKEVLIIADGWDEISSAEREDESFLYDLLLGDNLPFVSVLLTSRPTAKSDLYENPYIDQFVEILGFNRKNIREYIRSEFSNDQESADKLFDHLETNPLVESICIIPLNCAIICHLWRTCKSALPSTMTELYTDIILNIIYRNIKIRPGYQKIKMWKTFESLQATSEDLGQSWLLLCKFAFQAIEMNQIDFSQEDLNLHFPRGYEEILCFGLVQRGESCLDRVSFNFLHLTFQEYLAALHLARQPPESQLEICRLHAKSQRFAIVWRFFFGISFKLIKPETIGSISTQLVGILDQAPFFRVLCHCAFEANDRNVNLLVAEKFNGKSWNSFPHNAHDCAAVVNVIANTLECSEMEINFSGCGLHDKHLVDLGNVLARKRGKLKVRRLVLEDNMLTDEGIYNLFLEAIAAFQSLKELLLDGNRIGAEGIDTVISSGLTKLWLSDNPLGVSGLHELENAIRIDKLADLRELRLNRCLTSTDTDSCGEALTALAEALSVHCRNLRFLTLSGNDLGESGLQALGKALPQLARQRDCFHIHLNKTMFNDNGIKAFTQGLDGECHVTELELKDNDLHSQGVSHLADSMHSGKLAIRSLRLNGNPFQSEGALVIGKMLSNTNCCQFLNLSKCQLAEGKPDVTRNIGEQLCQLPQNDTIQQLILDENCFTGDCIHVLVGFIYLCPNMRFLLCKKCGITSNDLKDIITRLSEVNSLTDSSFKLEEWHLQHNQVDNTGAAVLCKQVQTLFPQLKHIYFDGNLVSDGMKKKLKKKLKEQRRKQETDERNQFMQQYIEWWPLEETVDYLEEMDFQAQWEIAVSHLFKLFMDALYIDQYPLVLEVIGEEKMEDSGTSMIHNDPEYNEENSSSDKESLISENSDPQQAETGATDGNDKRVCRLQIFQGLEQPTIDSTPKLRHLQLLELDDGKRIKVIELVAPYWKDLAMMLDFSVSRIKKIEMESHYKPEDACHRMFFEWLDGDSDLRGPVTWNTLIWCLKKLELKDDVAETMNSIFDPEIDRLSYEFRNSPTKNKGTHNVLQMWCWIFRLRCSAIVTAFILLLFSIIVGYWLFHTPQSIFFQSSCNSDWGECHEISHVADLMSSLANIGDWLELCTMLKVDVGTLNMLKYNAHHQKLDCLQAFLNQQSGCWETVVCVLCHKPLLETNLAKRIATEYGVDFDICCS